MRSVHIIVKGKVQGVFFRATARDIANQLGVKGWVKNTPEGFVEITATGNDDEIERFVAWCHEGPGRAEVTEVEVTQIALVDFENFAVLR